MATTINGYSVSLSLNANDYIKNSSLSRSETSQLRRAITELQTPAEKAANQLNVMSRAFTSAGPPTKEQTALLDRMHRKLNDVSSSTQKASNSTAILAMRYMSFAAIAQTVKTSISLDAELQQNTAAFDVFTGSAENAGKMINEMRGFAAATPLSFRAITDSAKTLMSFNVASEDVMPTLQRLGDITGGNTERFKMLSLAYAQSSAAGRLMGQDLLQMINSGFNPLQEISKQTGRSLVDLKKDMENGLITFDMVEGAFKSATDEGGKFNGMMDKIGGTSAGALAKAQSQLEMIAAKLGEEISPATVTILNTFLEWAPALNSAAENVGLVADSIKDVAGWIKSANEATKSFLPPVTFKAPLTNLRNLIDAGSKLAFGTMPQIRDMAVKMREEYGKGIFPKSINDKLDEHIQKQKDAIENAEKHNAAAEKMGSVVTDAFNTAKSSVEDSVGSVFSKLVDARKGLIDKVTSLHEQSEKMQTQYSQKQQAVRQRLAEQALQNARKYFEDERKRQMKIREDVASMMSGAGAEIGADSVRFNAQLRNREMAAAIAAPQAQPTDEQLLNESKKQLSQLEAQNKKQDAMVKTLERILEEQKQNGFKRLR